MAHPNPPTTRRHHTYLQYVAMAIVVVLIFVLLASANLESQQNSKNLSQHGAYYKKHWRIFAGIDRRLESRYQPVADVEQSPKEGAAAWPDDAPEAEAESSQPSIYVCFHDPSARLGNKMFQYAAGFGLAVHHRSRLVLVVNENDVEEALAALRRVFTLSSVPEQADLPPTVYVLPETGWARFNPMTQHAPIFRESVALMGYMQSWKYFAPAEAEIRREFSLEPRMVGLINSFFRASGMKRDTLRIGVHVRRGDMAHLSHLYATAPRSYIVKAVEYYRAKYGAEYDLSFVIATDDRPWVDRIFADYAPANATLVYARFSAEVDLAVLSQCNHSIITGGTFGWWAAWLAGGDVLYYKDFIRPSSPLYEEYDESDYYPPSWIGLS